MIYILIIIFIYYALREKQSKETIRYLLSINT